MKSRKLHYSLPVIFVLYVVSFINAAEASSEHHVHADVACTVALAPHPGDGAWQHKINALQRQVLRLSNNPDLLEQLAWMYVERAQQDEQPASFALVQATAECLQKTRPTAGKFFKAFVLYTQHQFHSAEKLLRKVAGERGLPVDYALLGDALFEQGDWEEAAKVYQRLMDLKPGPDAYVRAAWVRKQHGDLDAAVEFASLAAKAVGAPTTAASAWIHTQLADLLFERGDFDVSSQVLDAVRAHDNSADAHLLEGRLALARAESSAAVAAFEQAVSAEPIPLMQWALIEAYHVAGHPDRAAAVEQNLLTLGDHLDPRTVGLYLAHTGQRLIHARQLLEHEIHDRRDVETIDALAWVLHQHSERQQAWILIEEALASGTRHPRVHLHAALIAQALGNTLAFEQHREVARSAAHVLYPSERRLLEAKSFDLASFN